MKSKLYRLPFRLFICLTFLSITALTAQEYFPKNDGVKTKTTNYTAFTNATIIVSPTQTIKKGTLLIKDGKITNVGSNISIPKNTVSINLEGKSIYPSFIDVYSNFGISEPKPQRRSFGQAPQYDTNRKGYYWNEHIRAETNALDVFNYDSKKAEELRNAGFGVVNTHMQDGIVRGNGILVALNSEGSNADRLLDVNSAQYLSFNKSSASKQVYPTSLMGAMALLRQVYIDADWYAKGTIDTKDLTLEAFNTNKSLKQIFYAGDKHNALRADKIGDQFGVQYTIVGQGNEYQLVDEIKKTNATYIIPINFPKAFDVSNPYQADYINLEDMRYWNQAPTNLSVLAKNNVPFSLTAHSLKSLKDFTKNLQKAIDYGLDKTKALEALTTIPAQILGKSNQIGTLGKGMQANFLITDGDIFDSNTKLYENWVQGTKNVIKDMSVKDLSGNYTLNLDGKTYDLTFTGDANKPKATIKKDTLKLKGSVTYNDNWLGLILSDKGDNIQLNARIQSDSDNINGNAQLANGKTVNWSAIKKPSTSKDKKNKKDKNLREIMPITFPNIGYGLSEKPKEETMLFKNATVWTNENEGILKNTDVLIKNGKIAKVGSNLSAGSAKVIDATGKHLTAGIIDEHTHVAAQSVNEAGQNSSAEVTIEDNIDSEDINIYRNLGGGVTSMQILHGSANPIGGRSAIVKLKWGEIGDEMIYTNSPKFIKFALGENVKQSRYPTTTNRFPQSRMGVEQMLTDYFQRAKEYDAVKKSGTPFRKDIEMEVLAEILNKERFITAHSYVQSEINMLMKVAEKFNFNINTLTHILEGYKVADKMKAHGAGGSTFSDWWSYKYEVNDAIPYNASIMHNVGIVTAINSDDREMSRRLNQEAAKTVKYGGVSEEDAWKFVTLNPAKLLHIDDRVGSIKVGKDADVVLWTDHPLSVYAKAEKTIIEGKVYFDLEKDKKQRLKIQMERNQLINMMLNEKNGGAPTQAPKKRVKKELHCDTINY
ncbi:amidohydrolase family protein [Aureibaculum algae]|uniref:Amidohydrolase family protein n=1 Tax=Aureibaculum algae TaxID=2584122 RepID=A0A5B7TU69_9FLAO|nr:amidohydrolase family protein [Aureibaculum algae]QCX38783.1 amidohydrolase family protein [Aureibaculum algae]